MTTFICTGRIHPERANVSFERVRMQFEGGACATVSADASQLTVSLEDSSLDGSIAANIMAEDVATIIVGALGFSLGFGYSVEIIQVTEPDGTPHVFGVAAQGATTGQTLRIDPYLPIFNRAFRLSGKDVFFRLAVRDYLRAITDATDCATYCYRAVESIKSAFVFKTGVNRWDEMHVALGTDRSAITDTIKQYADAVRHGDWVNTKRTNKFERWKMLSLTRDILLKYLDHAAPSGPSLAGESVAGEQPGR